MLPSTSTTRCMTSSLHSRRLQTNSPDCTTVSSSTWADPGQVEASSSPGDTTSGVPGGLLAAAIVAAGLRGDNRASAAAAAAAAAAASEHPSASASVPKRSMAYGLAAPPSRSKPSAPPPPPLLLLLPALSDRSTTVTKLPSGCASRCSLLRCSAATGGEAGRLAALASSASDARRLLAGL